MPNTAQRQDILFATVAQRSSHSRREEDILDLDVDADKDLEVSLMQADYRQQIESREW